MFHGYRQNYCENSGMKPRDNDSCRKSWCLSVEVHVEPPKPVRLAMTYCNKVSSSCPCHVLPQRFAMPPLRLPIIDPKDVRPNALATELKGPCFIGHVFPQSHCEGQYQTRSRIDLPLEHRVVLSCFTLDSAQA